VGFIEIIEVITRSRSGEASNPKLPRWESPQTTGVIPVDGSRATSSAITTAVPRRKPYGEAIMRPTRMGISRSSLPWWLIMISWMGSGRSDGGVQSASERRSTRLRRLLPRA
jgi:hypothetical protein